MYASVRSEWRPGGVALATAVLTAGLALRSQCRRPCRHGGLTELEEAELTDGQGRALSTHKTQQSYEGYAKRTAKRMLSATRKRHAHRLASETATSIQNETTDSVQNEKRGFEKSA